MATNPLTPVPGESQRQCGSISVRGALPRQLADSVVRSTDGSDHTGGRGSVARGGNLRSDSFENDIRAALVPPKFRGVAAEQAEIRRRHRRSSRAKMANAQNDWREAT